MAGAVKEGFHCAECYGKTCYLFNRNSPVSVRTEYTAGKEPETQPGGCVWFNRHRTQILRNNSATSDD